MKSIVHGIEVDYSRDALLDEIGHERLKDSYAMQGETSPQERYAYVSAQFGSNPAHAQRLYDYASKHWFGYSTPILSYGRNEKGLPISCYCVNVDDSRRGLVDALSETNWLSMLGGGVGVYFGTRGADEKSVGVIPHIAVYDRSSLAYRQGTTRRGSYAMYLDISHPDILEFLDIRKETGDQNRRSLNLHHGVSIPDAFMNIIERCMDDPNADDTWELKDPSSGKVRERVSAKALWQTLLELRAGAGRGEPYIMFTDNVNNALRQVLKDVGYTVVQSNLCLTGDTLVNVECIDGTRTHLRLDVLNVVVNAGGHYKVLSYNTTTGLEEYKDVLASALTVVNAPLMQITCTSSGMTVKCTPNHKFWTENRGYIEAKDLRPTDTLRLNDYTVSGEIIAEYITERADVYDITVADNQNFYANDILVHNCNEIFLRTDAETTAVCCLSSINLEHWDEYQDNHQFFRDILEMLDNVLQRFIDDAPPQISRAIKSAIEERSIGLGVMGFHSYLQKRMIPFDCAIAKSVNLRIFKKFAEHNERANAELGAERGSPMLLAGTGLRFAHTSALAPTASNALICGNVSPSIEPWRANAFRQDTMSGTFIQKNKFLDRIIRDAAAAGELDYDETWAQIVQAEGSVQTIDALPTEVKETFKTAVEIDQLWLVEHAADRQPYIDQGQSFNVFIYPNTSIAKLHKIHFTAWKRGMKGMYYVRTEKLVNNDKVGQRVARVRIEEEMDKLHYNANETECLACSG